MDGAPVAVFNDSPASWSCDNLTFDRSRPGAEYRLRLAEPILFLFQTPQRIPPAPNRDQELWVLATIPRQGPPRPIALGIKKRPESKTSGHWPWTNLPQRGRHTNHLLVH